jgi:hypothetical protein
MRFAFAVTASLFIATSAFAAIPKQAAKKPTPTKILKGEGVTIGGLAGTGFTLLDLRRTADNKKKIERLVIDVGDRTGAPMKGWPGYYHAELKKNPARLVLDFSQMPNTKVDQIGLNTRLKNSLAVKKSNMTVDPVDSTLNLTLDLKPNTRVRIAQVPGKKATSKVVVDFIVE